MKTKVLFVYKDFNDELAIESLWATKEGEYYKLDNIPFFAKNIALGDIISVEEDEGALYFDSLIEASGHSTIRLIIKDENEVNKIGKEFENLGCSWEGSHIKNLISIDIPAEVDYSNIVHPVLEKGEQLERWQYEEGCLGFKL